MSRQNHGNIVHIAIMAYSAQILISDTSKGIQRWLPPTPTQPAVVQSWNAPFAERSLKTLAICKGIPPSSISKKGNSHQNLKMREEEEQEDFNLIQATETADFLFDFLLAPYVCIIWVNLLETQPSAVLYSAKLNVKVLYVTRLRI